MVIQAVCQCGKRVAVNDDLAGQDINCMRCGRTVAVPDLQAIQTEAAARRALERPPPPKDSWHEYVYWALALCFFPLAFHMGKDEETFRQRLDRTLSQHPEVRHRVEELVNAPESSIDDILAAIPGHRLEGSYLPRDTYLHWVFAGVAAGVFWVVVWLTFAPGTVPARNLLLVGLFTGTLGILILLISHIIPVFAVFIEWCMEEAHDASGDIIVSILAYTLGVGLFEEIAKLLPLLWYQRRYGMLTWRMACLWGLASGVGFGVTEGITYSATFYNGVADGDIYLVRFMSCVALHAIWSASAGISLFHQLAVLREITLPTQDQLVDRSIQGARNVHPLIFNPITRMEIGIMGAVFGNFDTWMYIMIVIRSVIVVMILHGLYDGLLTKELNLWALAVAAASFGWLVWQIEQCRKQEIQAAAEDAPPAQWTGEGLPT